MRARIAHLLLILLFAFAVGRHVQAQTKLASTRRSRPACSRVVYPMELRDRGEFRAQVEFARSIRSILQPAPDSYRPAGWFVSAELGSVSFVRHSDDVCYLFMSLQC